MRFLSAALLLALCRVAAAAPESHSHYLLYIFIDDDADIARISGEWRLPPAAEAVQALEFLLTPLASDPVLGASCAGRELPIAGTRRADEGGDRRWSLLFASACAAESPLVLSFHYEYVGTAAPQLRITRGEGFASGSGELWYPQEDFDVRETGEISIETAAGLESIATGDPGDSLTEGGRVSSLFQLRTPGKLAFAYGQYRVAVHGRATVLQLAGSLDADVEAVAQTAARAWQALTQAFGPLPHADLRIVEVDFQSRVTSTSEAGMLFVDPSRMHAAGNELPHWAHELALQWWGVSVRPFASSPGAAMLTEGMAQYGAFMALEASAGADAAREYRRVGQGDDTAGSLAGYRALVADGWDKPIAEFVPQDQAEARLAERLAISKGALALHGLGERFGRDRLHAVLRSFLERHRGRRTSWSMLEEELVRAFGKPAAHYLGAWFHTTGWPEIP